MKKNFTLPILLLFLVSFMGSAFANDFPVTIIDDMGWEVFIESKPERIISMTPNTTEILFALGLGERIIGVTDFCNYPLEALEKDSIGGIDATIEPVMALEPHLIVSTNMNSKETVERLIELGYPVVVIVSKTFEDVFPAISLLGQATGHRKEASLLLERLNAELEEIKKLLATVTKTPLVFYEIWHDPFFSVNKDTFIGQLITMAGGENLTHDAASEYPVVSLETIIDRNPQVYILAAGHGELQTPQNIKARTGFDLLDAVQNNRISFVDTDIISRPGPRIVEALEILARSIHPELFK